MLLGLVSLSLSASPYIVLYAGSNTWGNYRHQADIFTLYNILTVQNGIDPHNIQVAAYDDIANSPSNPYAGSVFHSTDHKVNVYPGSDKINYRQTTVTAATYYTLASRMPTTAYDYVFFYYDDHGDIDILGVPDGCGDYIYGEQLAESFQAAQADDAWKQLFYGIEACYAGTIGEQMPNSTFATITASNAQESSYAAVYDSQLGTYLTNEFTMNFIAELVRNPTETLGELYENVKGQTTESHATWYGDPALKDTPISNFFGLPKGELLRYPAGEGIRKVLPKVATQESLAALSESRIPAVRARARIAKLDGEYRTQRLEIVLDEIVKAVDIKNYVQVQKPVAGKAPEGYGDVLRHFFAKFGRYNPDDAGRIVVLKNLCRTHPASEVIAAIDAIL